VHVHQAVQAEVHMPMHHRYHMMTDNDKKNEFHILSFTCIPVGTASAGRQRGG
jgi:hypothetical protein